MGWKGEYLVNETYLPSSTHGFHRQNVGHMISELLLTIIVGYKPD